MVSQVFLALRRSASWGLFHPAGMEAGDGMLVRPDPRKPGRMRGVGVYSRSPGDAVGHPIFPHPRPLPNSH